MITTGEPSRKPPPFHRSTTRRRAVPSTSPFGAAVGRTRRAGRLGANDAGGGTPDRGEAGVNGRLRKAEGSAVAQTRARYGFRGPVRSIRLRNRVFKTELIQA